MSGILCSQALSRGASSQQRAHHSAQGWPLGVTSNGAPTAASVGFHIGLSEGTTSGSSSGLSTPHGGECLATDASIGDTLQGSSKGLREGGQEEVGSSRAMGALLAGADNGGVVKAVADAGGVINGTASNQV